MSKEKLFEISELENLMNKWGFINSIAWHKSPESKKEATDIYKEMSALRKDVDKLRDDFSKIRYMLEDIHSLYKF